MRQKTLLKTLHLHFWQWLSLLVVNITEGHTIIWETTKDKFLLTLIFLNFNKSALVFNSAYLRVFCFYIQVCFALNNTETKGFNGQLWTN